MTFTVAWPRCGSVMSPRSSLCWGPTAAQNEWATVSVNNADRDMFHRPNSPRCFSNCEEIAEALLRWCGRSLSAPDKRGQYVRSPSGFRGEGRSL